MTAHITVADRRGRDYDVEGTATEHPPAELPAARAVSEPALSLAFFDPEHGLYGTARAGATLLFDGERLERAPAGPAISRERRELERRAGRRLRPRRSSR